MSVPSTSAPTLTPAPSSTFAPGLQPGFLRSIDSISLNAMARAGTGIRVRGFKTSESSECSSTVPTTRLPSFRRTDTIAAGSSAATRVRHDRASFTDGCAPGEAVATVNASAVAMIDRVMIRVLSEIESESNTKRGMRAASRSERCLQFRAHERSLIEVRLVARSDHWPRHDTRVGTIQRGHRVADSVLRVGLLITGCVRLQKSDASSDGDIVVGKFVFEKLIGQGRRQDRHPDRLAEE